jgi:hypothetical protein
MSRPGIGAAVERIKQFAHDCVGVVMAPLGMVEGCQKREVKKQERKERASKTGFFKDAGDDYVLLDGAEPPVVYRRCMLVTASMFMGYAALVTLQHKLKTEHDKAAHAPDDSAFEHASQLNYLGNLLFRLAHNFVFAFLTPRQRVHLSLLCMALASGILAVFVCLLRSPWIGWVVLAYLLGGVAVGTHESNLLACITPLGHATKKWAILGLPLGFTFTSVGGFLLLLSGVPLVALYLLNSLLCVVSMAVFTTVPAIGVYGGGSDGGSSAGAGGASAAADGAGSGMPPPVQLPPPGSAKVRPAGKEADAWLGLSERERRAVKGRKPWVSVALDPLPPTPFERFRSNLGAWRSWLPAILPHSIALLLNMLCVSFMTAIMYYLLNDSGQNGQVALLGPNTTRLLVPHDAFFAVYNFCIYLGDSLSRQLVYKARALAHPFWFLIASVVGAALGLCKIPLLAPLGLFCVFFANGAIYATSTKFIDSHVDRATTLTALSIWLFIGDFGSVIGSNTWQMVAPLVCAGVDAPHMCLPESR